MQFFEGTDVRAACAAIQRFSQKANWRWKGLPVLTWEFADRAQFEEARATLKMALDKELLPSSPNAIERINKTNQSDIDCFGVTFRLFFREV